MGKVKSIFTFLLGWLGTGFGALVGSILGNAAGKTGLTIGAIAGGILAVLVVVRLAVRFSWLAAGSAFAAAVFGIFGFGIAVPLTLANMGSPLIPVLSCSLVGAGILLGAAIARRQNHS
jgi:hypothetical protein